MQQISPLNFRYFQLDPKLQPQVNEEENLDEGQEAHAQAQRQVRASRHQSFDESVNEFTLEGHLGLHQRPRDARVVEPEHCVGRLLVVLNLVAVLQARAVEGGVDDC